MPTHFKAQVYWQVGSMLPRDRVTIDPCFRHQQSRDLIPDVDWQTLANDLATAIKAWETAPTNQELTVKLYEIGQPAPNRPKATKILQANTSQILSSPPELALCLSFYGGPNAPRNRGRLYLPHGKFSNAAPGFRPTQAERDKVGALATDLAALGGSNVDWGVWSPTNEAFTKADHWFVDDEWDVQRRRGQKASARSAGTTSG